MIPRNFEARRFGDAHQAQFLAKWTGGSILTAIDGLWIMSADGKVAAHTGDWIIRAADGSVRIGPHGSQDGYCADCGEPVWRRDERLVSRDGSRWCFGPDRSRTGMTRWHALPGTDQYVVPAAEGQVCYCLDRPWPHLHMIVPVSEHPLPPGWHHSGASSLDTCGECTGGLVAAGVRCNCGPGPEGQHQPLCGFIPCPAGCWERLHQPVLDPAPFLNAGLPLADDDSEAQADAAQQRAAFIAPVETGEPWRSAAERDWDSSRD